jgi:cell division protein FtsB
MFKKKIKKFIWLLITLLAGFLYVFFKSMKVKKQKQNGTILKKLDYITMKSALELEKLNEQEKKLRKEQENVKKNIDKLNRDELIADIKRKI